MSRDVAPVQPQGAHAHRETRPLAGARGRLCFSGHAAAAAGARYDFETKFDPISCMSDVSEDSRTPAVAVLPSPGREHSPAHICPSGPRAVVSPSHIKLHVIRTYMFFSVCDLVPYSPLTNSDSQEGSLRRCPLYNTLVYTGSRP